MPTISFDIKQRVNGGLVMSPSELLQSYFYGIEIKSKDGTVLSEDVLREKIVAAQDEIEKLLSIKIFRSVHYHRVDFERNDYYNWGFINCVFPVMTPLSLIGYIGTVQQIEYPLGWLSNYEHSDETYCNRNIHIVPAGTSDSRQASSVVFSGITPHLGFMGMQTIPNYWMVKFCTGYKHPSPFLIEVIGKYASIQIFNILGDIVLGAGIASMSLGVDGLSQSISTTSSAENAAYSARIKQYLQELKEQVPRLVSIYKGITFMAM